MNASGLPEFPQTQSDFFHSKYSVGSRILSEHGSVVFGRIMADMLLGHQPIVPWLDQASWEALGSFVDYIATDEALAGTIWAVKLA